MIGDERLEVKKKVVKFELECESEKVTNKVRTIPDSAVEEGEAAMRRHGGDFDAVVSEMKLRLATSDCPSRPWSPFRCAIPRSVSCRTW